MRVHCPTLTLCLWILVWAASGAVNVPMLAVTLAIATVIHFNEMRHG